MKLLLLVLALGGAYAFVLLSSANQMVYATERLHATYGHVAETADQWSEGNTAVSFEPTR